MREDVDVLMPTKRRLVGFDAGTRAPQQHAIGMQGRNAPQRDPEHRFTYFVLVSTIVLPRVVLGGTAADAAVLILVWGAIGFVVSRSNARLPAAIVRRPDGSPVRRWARALAAGTSALARVPLAYGRQSILPWRPRF
jgi:hypothetical protein